MKIVNKIIVLVVVSVFTIMGAVSIYSSRQSQEIMTDQVKKILNTELDFAAIEVAHTQLTIRRTAEVLAHDRAIRRALDLGESRGINQILNDMMAIYPFFNFVIIAEPDGAVFAASTKDGQGNKINGEQILGLDIRRNPLFKGFTGKEIIIGQPGEDPFLTKIGLKRGATQWFVVPIKRRGVEIGEIVLSYNWEKEVSALLDEITRKLIDVGSPAITTVLMDSSGNIKAGKSINDGHFGSEENFLSRRKQVSFGATVLDVVIVNDRKKTYQPVDDARNALLLIIALGSLLLVTLLYFALMRILISKISVLYEGTTELSSGNLEYRLPTLGNDELGSLGAAFNRMTEKLHETTVSRDEMAELAERESVLKVAAEAANRAKSDFLNVMSHELRTPLTVILGYTPILTKPQNLPSVKRLSALLETENPDAREVGDNAKEILDEFAKYAGKADNSGKHLLTLINDMLDLSKIESGSMELTTQTVYVDDVARVIIEQFCQSAEDKDLVLSYETKGEKVVADETRLRQILINLVGNAIKFTDSGSINVQTNQEGEFVEFQVSDTGCGIPENEAENVFERFRQIDGSATRKAGGTGLGLAITKSLVELHGGSIGVTSTPDQGSTFSFTIPSVK